MADVIVADACWSYFTVVMTIVLSLFTSCLWVMRLWRILFLNHHRLFRNVSQRSTFGEDRGAMRRGYGKTSIWQVARDFTLRILVGVLTIEVSSPYKSTFLAILLALQVRKIRGESTLPWMKDRTTPRTRMHW